MSSENPQDLEDDLLDEYRFDYRKAKPNRFAVQSEIQQHRTIILDEDVAKVFTTPEAVNKALRTIIASMPQN